MNIIKHIYYRNKEIMRIIIIYALILIVISILYSLPTKQIVMIDSGDMLSYIATVGGFTNAVYLFILEKRKERKERIRNVKPKLSVTVRKSINTHKNYIFTIHNSGDKDLRNVYIHETHIDEILFPNSEIKKEIEAGDIEKKNMSPHFPHHTKTSPVA